MYTRTAAAQLAVRVRSLLGPQAVAAIGISAADLGVPDGDLREIVQYETRYPTVAVLAALVAYYGVDAAWLLTGDYSPALHRVTAAADTPPKTIVTELLREADGRRTDRPPVVGSPNARRGWYGASGIRRR